MASNATSSESSPTVVGIGASAGGLAALKQFLHQLPGDTGLIFVVVVHLSPDHESHLAELLQPHTSLQVEQVVAETTALERNHIYVIPPNANLNAIDTHLRLSKLETRRQERAPIDHFFRTLSETHDGNAIAIVLTGTGSDGTLGIKDVKASGGLVIVQDPNEAEYDGMPQSAIATGLVDLILPLAEIPGRVIKYHRTEPRVALPADGEESPIEERMLLQKVFAQLRTRTDRDFTHYKRSSVMRRISRRMQLNYVEDLKTYIDLLREKPEEVRALADDLLITVTHFFRDPEVFEKLGSEQIPRIFSHKSQSESVRAWSVGCATGEEAYSLAILLSEEAAKHDIAPQVQVFASDLHSRSLERARDGIYPGDIETDVNEARLKRYFHKENGGYRIIKEIRDLVVFTPHNLLADPPFSRLDLISCRNLLIYLDREIQRDVIELFHYALNPDGVLLLGSAETMEGTELFRVEDKRLCIFRKRNVPTREPRLPVFPMIRTPKIPNGSREEAAPQPVSYGSIHQKLVEQYAPPSILVGPDNRVVHLSEHAGRYLLHPGGEPTASVLKLVREELRIELQSSLQFARENRRALDSRPIPVRFNGSASPVVVHVRPAMDSERDGFVLIIFEEREPESDDGHVPESSSAQSAEQVAALEEEVHVTRQRLQAMIEEYETGREEMKASNEEMQSTNEELRSTMEELETSKEELQSINEELQTVNQQNRLKVEELGQLSSDLQNLLSATEIATLFLDRELRIMRFTPKLSELYNVRVTDRGRPISDLTQRIGYDSLREDAETVRTRLIPIEREVQDEHGRWYLTRVLPYRSGDDRIEGVVITFIDIHSRKQAEEQLRQSQEYAENIINSLHEPLIVLTPSLEVRLANPAFYRVFQVEPYRTLKRRLYELGNGQWNIPGLLARLEDVVRKRDEFTDFEVDHVFEQIGRRVILVSARSIENATGILVGLRDITERKRVEEQRIELLAKDQALEAEKAMRSNEAQLARVVRALSVAELATSIAHEINQPLTGVITNAQAALRWLSGDKPNVQEGIQSLKLVARDGNLAGEIVVRIREFLTKETRQPESLRLNDVIREAIAIAESELVNRKIQTQLELADDLPEIVGDRIQLQQVVLNLVMNSADAMTSVAGKRELVVSSKRTDDGVSAVVRDSGTGIPPEHMPRMFEAFFSTKPEGIGMGLSISRTIVEAHGGKIWAEANPKGGLTVQFSIPALKSGKSK